MNILVKAIKFAFLFLYKVFENIFEYDKGVFYENILRSACITSQTKTWTLKMTVLV